MALKRLPVVVAVALAAGFTLGGCTGGSDPVVQATPTPSALSTGPYLGFETEEEAIAAAEAVYAEYIDRTNALWSGDLAARPTDVLTGEAYALEIELAAIIAAEGLTLEGVTSSDVLETKLESGQSVLLTACQKVDGRVIDRSGRDVTPDGRPDKQALRIHVERDANNQLRISSSEAVTDSRC